MGRGSRYAVSGRLCLLLEHCSDGVALMSRSLLTYSYWLTLQAVFSLSEMLSTCFIVPLCDVTRPPTPRRCLTLLSLAVFRIIAAGYDQFTENVLLGRGAWHQWSRDMGFMVVDVLHVVIATCWWRRASCRSLLSRDEVLLSIVCVILLFVLALVTWHCFTRTLLHRSIISIFNHSDDPTNHII